MLTGIVQQEKRLTTRYRYKGMDGSMSTPVGKHVSVESLQQEIERTLVSNAIGTPIKGKAAANL